MYNLFITGKPYKFNKMQGHYVYIWQNIPMRFVIPLIAISLFITSCFNTKETGASQSTQGSDSYIAPGYEKKKYKKIMVMALLPENTYRKRLELGLVKELQSRGYKVVPSIDIYTNEMLKDSVKMRATAEAAGVDAAIVLHYLGNATSISQEGHYNSNIYSFYGYPFSVVDVETSSIKTGLIQLDFFVGTTLGTQYRTGVVLKQSNQADDAVMEFAINARRKLVGDKIL
jgi:hypothetical protein